MRKRTLKVISNSGLVATFSDDKYWIVMIKHCKIQIPKPCHQLGKSINRQRNYETDQNGKSVNKVCWYVDVSTQINTEW